MFLLKSQKANCPDKDVSGFVTVKFFRSVFYLEGNGLALFDGRAWQYYTAFTFVDKSLVSSQLSATCSSREKKALHLTFVCVSKIIIKD